MKIFALLSICLWVVSRLLSINFCPLDELFKAIGSSISFSLPPSQKYNIFSFHFFFTILALSLRREIENISVFWQFKNRGLTKHRKEKKKRKRNEWGFRTRLLWVCWSWSYWKIWKSNYLFLLFPYYFLCLSFISYLVLYSCFQTCLYKLVFKSSFFTVFCLQYNEILGKGASKTVYEAFFCYPSAFSFKIYTTFWFFFWPGLFFLLGFFGFQLKLKDLLFILALLVVTAIEPLMSMKGLKWHGTKLSSMIFCKILKILRDSTVKFICSRP